MGWCFCFSIGLFLWAFLLNFFFPEMKSVFGIKCVWSLFLSLCWGVR